MSETRLGRPFSFTRKSIVGSIPTSDTKLITLINTCMKLNQLTETRARVIRRRNGENIGYYTSKKTRHPLVMVVPVNNDRYFVISITKAGIEEFKELSEQEYYARNGSADPLSPSQEDLKRVFMGYAMAMDGSFNKYPEYFNEHEVDLAGLFKILMNTYRIGPQYLKPNFGDVPDADDDEKYGDVTLMMTDGLSAASLKKMKQGLDATKEALSRVNLGSLVAGKFRVASLGGRKALATYQYGSSITTLDPRGFGKGTAVTTLIHELGHKWEDTAGLENNILTKWNEIAKAGHNFTGRPAIEVGDEILLSGAQFKKYHGYVFTIKSASSKGYAVAGINTNVNKTLSGTMPLDMFINGGAEMADGSGEIQIVDGDPWFPSRYSTTDHHEFFAENFMRYVAGTASDEVTEWMNSLPRP
jgi:hypothetical protein